MSKILLTGAGGYIGSIFSKLFLEDGFQVIALDNFSFGYKTPLKVLEEQFGNKNIQIYNLDIKQDLYGLFKKEKNIDVVIHLAALTSLDKSFKDVKNYYNNNIFGSYNLLNAMVNAGLDRMIFSSTSAVYKEIGQKPIDEKQNTYPGSPYGESKLMFEKILQLYGERLGLKYIIFRYFNVCGASENGEFGDSKNPSQLLLTNAIRAALDISPFYITCSKVKTKDGTPVRDYINIIDLYNAHIKAINYLSKGGRSEIINLGTNKGTSVKEIILKVKEITGVDFSVNRKNIRKNEREFMVSSNQKANKLLNWRPKNTLEESILSTIKWYNKMPKGWNR